MMVFPGYLKREITRSSTLAIVFILCVGLSLVTLTAFTGFSKSVNQSLLNDARKLHAADIIIRSYEPLSKPLERVTTKLNEQGTVAMARYHEFYSVVRRSDDTSSVLSLLKVVEKGYPFYGEVILRSGRALNQVLASGQTVVGQSLMDRLGLVVGDRIQVGHIALTIRDVVLSEPDRPIRMFSFGPRVFIAHEDLDALGLLQTGSRIRYVTLLKVEDGHQLDLIYDRLRAAADLERERVDTFQTAQSRVKRFFDNFIFFLKLVGIFILTLSGVGIQSTLSAFLSAKQKTIGIMKALGASNRHVLVHFTLVVMLLGSIGMGMGILAGVFLQYGLAKLLSGFLPVGMPFLIAWSGLVESVILGVLVVLIFSFVPLYRLRGLRPVMILRHDVYTRVKRWPVWISYGIFGIFFFGLVLRHMQDFRFGLYFVVGVGGLITLTAVATYWMLKGLKRLSIRNLTLRQAVKSLFRKGAATQTIMVSLTTSLCVIFSIYLVEKNLDATFVRSFPQDTPNLFFLDIQPDQKTAFNSAMNRDIQLYPIVRARVTHINDVIIDRQAERTKKRDNLARVFNLTYRHHLLADEIIQKGRTLFREDWQEVQVSVLDMVVDMHPMDIGDRIQFNIQGVPLTARIASIRSRLQESLRPFFYFVFEEKTLRSAPQTMFSAMRVPAEEIGPLQTRMVSQFPNVSVIDMSETIRVFAGLMKQLSRIVRAFSALSMSAGILILISAIFATRAERINESVYYKILGAGRSFVLSVFSLENLLMGLCSGILAVVISQVGAGMICRFVLEIEYRLFLPACALMVLVAVFLVNGIGLLSARSILGKKPITYLREQQDA
jgi:putative ABC transport system permease protein